MKKHARGKWAGIIVPVIFTCMLLSPCVFAPLFVHSVVLTAAWMGSEDSGGRVEETQRRGEVLVRRLRAYSDRYGGYPKAISALDGNPASSPELVPVWDDRQWWYFQLDEGADFELGFSPYSDGFPYYSYRGSTGRWFRDD